MEENENTHPIWLNYPDVYFLKNYDKGKPKY